MSYFSSLLWIALPGPATGGCAEGSAGSCVPVQLLKGSVRSTVGADLHTVTAAARVAAHETRVSADEACVGWAAGTTWT